MCRFWWYWQGEKRPDYIAFVNKTYGPGFTYADFAPHFKASLFEPKRWAKTFEASGAKYGKIYSFMAFKLLHLTHRKGQYTVF